MTEPLLIVVTVLLVISIALLAVLLAKKPNNDSKHEIEHLKDSIEDKISISITKELVNVMDQLNKNNEVNNEKLERFQNNINESFEKKFNYINETMNNSINAMNKRVDEKLEGGFKNTNETFSNVLERLATIDNAQKNMEALSSDVVSLKSILENNQQRGQYGEFQLKMILHNVFQDSVGLYQEQYTIKKGKTEETTVRADAVVFLPPPYNMVCIDSKFPFSAYKDILNAQESSPKLAELKKTFRADIKKHITDIKNKYIIPDKTAPQAFMFIPSDGIFAYMHVEMHDVIEEAQFSNVIVSSPATLQSMLSTLAMLKINYDRSQNLNVITEQLKGLQKDFIDWNKEWKKLSSHLQTVTNTRDDLDKRFEQMNKKFGKLSIAQVSNESEEEIELISEENMGQ